MSYSECILDRKNCNDLQKSMLAYIEDYFASFAIVIFSDEVYLDYEDYD